MQTDALKQYFCEVGKCTVDIEDLLSFLDGRKFAVVAECGRAFEDGVFVGWEYSADANTLYRLRGIGCRSVGVSHVNNDELSENSELVGLINNGDFYGCVTIKNIYAQKECMNYILKYGF